jgi:phosphatidylglycerol:prolipoprotein diacylglycerol transferase
MVCPVHKIAFQLGGLSIYWYGILVALGFLVGLWTASRRGLRDGLNPMSIIDLGPWLVVGSLAGARVLYVMSYWNEYYASRPFWEVFMIRQGGLVFYGGLIGAVVVALFYLHWKKLPLWKVADALAPSIALGYVPGRIGCLMYGCCYGRATNLPWGIRFPADHETAGQTVHPTQLYDAFLNLGLYVLLAWAYRRKRFDGQIFALYLMAYAALRAFVEYFRGDYQTIYFGNWATPAQVLSLLIFLIGAGMWWQLSRAKQTVTS